ncbi:hypothetical protein PIB30_027710 [Stylosanthes scabra]|uniref:Uncharacterized protein n=1 Tax=Stylosanthes scabra TaxID=79078 RepID=A0ABU6VCW5_9FABA|nr:hypothetical protein [Stylosanthes scabra]
MENSLAWIRSNVSMSEGRMELWTEVRELERTFHSAATGLRRATTSKQNGNQTAGKGLGVRRNAMAAGRRRCERSGGRSTGGGAVLGELSMQSIRECERKRVVGACDASI